MTAALQKWNDDLFEALLRVLDWSTCVDQLHSLRFGQRDLQISIAYACVKVVFLDVETVASRRSSGCTSGGATG
jgi:hypothetical protein